jgi:RimJ/RimL family protein N-acetyltransferase
MEITHRTATLNDAAVLLAWRNDSSAREFSINSEIIPMDEHLMWLSDRLQRVQLEPFFLFAMGDNLIGMSRLDVVSGSDYKNEISILVDSRQRSKGIGARILNITCNSFFNLHPDKSIVANVHRSNFVSQKLFERGGFKLITSEDEFLSFEKNLN